MPFNFRFAIAVAALTGTAWFISVHHSDEFVPQHEELRSIPLQLGPWHGTDQPISSGTLSTLGSGDFLSRSYTEQSAASSVNLFIAYFPTQSTGSTIHSPENCLPGSGWFPLQSGRITISAQGHDPFPANRFYIAKGDDRALVLYWYWSHNRGIASEYVAKFYLVADAIRWNRSDGALIRVTAPVRRGQTTESAQQALLGFSNELVPLIDHYIAR